MSKLKLMGLVLLCICMAPLSAPAADFDGSRSLICASVDVIECDEGEACREVTPESINAPRFLKVNFQEKKISTRAGSADKRTTEIQHMGRVDGKLILQGMEDGVEGVRDGLGWSLAISEETGKMVLTGSGDQVGFVLFGACIPD